MEIFWYLPTQGDERYLGTDQVPAAKRLGSATAWGVANGGRR